jgi:DNA-binding transcriptional MocR family regulator
MIEEGNRFVVVLIGRSTFIKSQLGVGALIGSSDEVESLTAARAAAMAGTEPSDGLRVSSTLRNQSLSHLIKRVAYTYRSSTRF